jgi:hypothetical protein
MAALTPCSAEISELYDCLLREPLSRWECDEDGSPAIREGSCEGEQARVARCLHEKVKP